MTILTQEMVDQISTWENYIAWAKTHDPNGMYSYFDCRLCPNARFYQSKFPEGFIDCGGSYINYMGGRSLLIPQAFDIIAQGIPNTFGRLMERAEKLQHLGDPKNRDINWLGALYNYI